MDYIKYLRTKFEPIEENFLDTLRELEKVTKSSAVYRIIAIAEKHDILATFKEAEDYLIVLLCDNKINIEKKRAQLEIRAV